MLHCGTGGVRGVAPKNGLRPGWPLGATSLGDEGRALEAGWCWTAGRRIDVLSKAFERAAGEGRRLAGQRAVDWSPREGLGRAFVSAGTVAASPHRPNALGWASWGEKVPSLHPSLFGSLLSDSYLWAIGVTAS